MRERCYLGNSLSKTSYQFIGQQNNPHIFSTFYLNLRSLRMWNQAKEQKCDAQLLSWGSIQLACSKDLLWTNLGYYILFLDVVKIHEINNFKRFYFGSWLQRFQSMVGSIPHFRKEIERREWVLCGSFCFSSLFYPAFSPMHGATYLGWALTLMEVCPQTHPEERAGGKNDTDFLNLIK